MKERKKDPYVGLWLLRDNKANVLFHSMNIVEVVEEGRKYPVGEVSIEKRFEQGTCFF